MARKKIIITDITPSGDKLTDDELRLVKGGQPKGGGGAGTSKTVDYKTGVTDSDTDF